MQQYFPHAGTAAAAAVVAGPEYASAAPKRHPHSSSKTTGLTHLHNSALQASLGGLGVVGGGACQNVLCGGIISVLCFPTCLVHPAKTFSSLSVLSSNFSPAFAGLRGSCRWPETITRARGRQDQANFRVHSAVGRPIAEGPPQACLMAWNELASSPISRMVRRGELLLWQVNKNPDARGKKGKTPTRRKQRRPAQKYLL